MGLISFVEEKILRLHSEINQSWTLEQIKYVTALEKRIAEMEAYLETVKQKETDRLSVINSALNPVPVNPILMNITPSPSI